MTYKITTRFSPEDSLELCIDDLPNKLIVDIYATKLVKRGFDPGDIKVTDKETNIWVYYSNFEISD